MALNVLTDGDPRETLHSDPVTTLVWEGTLDAVATSEVLFTIPVRE